jgi:PAS domain S-box-containing protein
MLPPSRFLLLISAALGALLILLLIAARLVLLPSFVELEEKEARANAERAVNAFAEESSSLTSMAVDYAGWDDSYRFVVSKNEEYIRKNLDDPFFLKFRVNLVVYVNNRGEWVYYRCYDLEKKRSAPLPESLRSILVRGSPLLRHADVESKHEGILALPEGLILLSSLPILTSEFRGPIRGTLLLGRFLNPAAVRRVAGITKLSLRLYSVNDPRLPIDPFSLHGDGRPRLQPVYDTSISAYILWNDFYGKPAAIIQVDIPRTTYRQGIRTIFYFMAWFTVFSGIIAVVSSFFARKMVLVQRSGEESKSRYQAIVEAFDGMLSICSPDNRLLFMNRGLMELAGRDATGENFREVFHDLLQNGEDGDDNRVFQGETVRCEMHNPRDDRWYYVIHSPIFHSDGTIAKLSMFTDITESKRADREKEELEEQLQQSRKMEAVGLLAGGIAHDFNNILYAIVGFGTLIQMNMQQDHPDRPHMDQILAATERATHLINSLLAFGRKQVLDPRPEDLNYIVQGIEKILRRVITEDIELRLNLAGRRLSVRVDSSQIDQVLINLAANARDAMPGGGILTICTGESFPPADLFPDAGFSPSARYALLTVSDSGAGMESRVMERIFDPFYTTKEVGKGTGLGLAAVYGIVTQHNGYITVESEPGKGTIFRIWLPLIGGGTVLTEANGFDTSSFRGSETVLVVEDDHVLRLLNRTVLEKAGYRVIEAANGDDAVTQFRLYRDEIMLVIMDLVMPKMNGRKAYAEICKIRPGVKVIFISGYAADVISEKGISTDGFRFIQKPIKPREYLREVRAELDRREAWQGRDV